MRCHFTILMLTTVGSGIGQTLELSNGKTVQVTSAKPEPSGAKIVYQDQERIVPWAEIAAISWPENPEEKAAITAVQNGAPLVRVIDLWSLKRPWLAKPRSNAGDFGLAYAAELAKRSLADEQARARELYVEIATQDWSVDRRDTAAVERMKLDLRGGKLAEVQKEIAELPATATAALQMDARYALAAAQWKALEALVKEHPKWQEEEDIIPQYKALSQSVQDALYYAVLFHGSDEARGSRNLTELAKFYTFLGDKKTAEAVRRDLKRLYPAADGKETP